MISYPASKKIYYHGKLFPNLRVGMCEIQLTNGDALILYDTSPQVPTRIRILPSKSRMDCLDCVNHRLKNGQSMMQLACAKRGIITPEIEHVGIRENQKTKSFARN